MASLTKNPKRAQDEARKQFDDQGHFPSLAIVYLPCVHDTVRPSNPAWKNFCKMLEYGKEGIAQEGKIFCAGLTREYMMLFLQQLNDARQSAERQTGR